jgi:hypothetical protein
MLTPFLSGVEKQRKTGSESLSVDRMEAILFAHEARMAEKREKWERNKKAGVSSTAGISSLKYGLRPSQ